MILFSKAAIFCLRYYYLLFLGIFVGINLFCYFLQFFSILWRTLHVSQVLVEIFLISKYQSCWKSISSFLTFKLSIRALCVLYIVRTTYQSCNEDLGRFGRFLYNSTPQRKILPIETKCLIYVNVSDLWSFQQADLEWP